jgi:hypothetical protein
MERSSEPNLQSVAKGSIIISSTIALALKPVTGRKGK